MTLRRKLALRYAGIVVICLLLLAGLAHHEFVVEPRQRMQLGIPELPETSWSEYAEVFFYSIIPFTLGAGWWLMRKTLAPIDNLARGVERIHAGNLHEPLPRTGNGDEVDRLTEVFNSLTSRLDQSFQQIREFTLHSSHELRTPLTVMRGELETRLREDNQLTAEQREWMHSQLDELQRLSKLVDGLLLLTKADSGQLTMERMPVPLGELMRECYEDALLLAESQEIHVELSVCDDITVTGDRHRLRQLLLNLADNAVKYNHHGGRIVMALRMRAESAEVEIANTGNGISQEFQPRVFDRFFRGNLAHQNGVEGCGLGLTICQWIVHEHQGTIQVQSGPGQLTRFTVTLPLAQAS